MGAVHMRTAHGRALRHDLTDPDREALLIRLYDPHHKAFDDMVKAALDAVGKCLILDAHSFPSVPLPCDVDQSPGRPDICIGTDGIYTSDELILAVRDIFMKRGFDVAVNRPYSGTIVPISFWRRDNRVLSLMFEVNRTLYMDEETGAKLDTYGDFRKTPQECLLGIKKFYDRRLSGDYIGGNDIE
jgi:N-formylglutamate deformylase